MTISSKAKPQSSDSIKNIVKNFKENYGISLNGEVDVIQCLDKLLVEDFLEYEIVPDTELKGSYAETDLYFRKILIKENVYLGAVQRNSRDRFTLAHELGHMVLHTQGITLCRNNEKINTYEDPEWQANQFAAEFLVPLEKIYNMNISEIANTFQVSIEMATYRKKAYIKKYRL